MDNKAKLERLESIIAGEIIGQWSKDYDVWLKGYWNQLARDFRPLAFILPANANDIVAATKFCINNKLPITVRSGGHECSPECYVQQSVVFDLSQLKQIRVKKDSERVKVQTGTLIDEINRETLKFGLAGTFGSFPSIGIGGQAMHLGVGSLSRSYGLLMDNILEYRLVDARGYQLTASEKSNPDLFWGMKMFGANFGIVTELTIKLHKINDPVFGGRIYIRWKDARDVLRFFRNLEDHNKLPQELSLSIYLQIVPAGFCVLIRLMYNGSPDEGLLWFNNLKKISPVDFDLNDLKVQPYLNLQQEMANEFPEDPMVMVNPSQLIKDMTDEYIDTIIRYFSRLSPEENVSSIFEIMLLGGAISDISDDSSPYPYRKAKFSCVMYGLSKTREGIQKLEKLQSDLAEDLEEYDMAPDYNIFTPALDRLTALKNKHDPNNCFCYNWFNIIPEK